MPDEVDLSQDVIALDNASALARVINRAPGRGPEWIDGVPSCRECGDPIPAKRLAAALRTLRGRWLLSINDCPEIRAVFAGFRLEELATSYTVCDRGSHAARELLISNYEEVHNAR